MHCNFRCQAPMLESFQIVKIVAPTLAQFLTKFDAWSPFLWATRLKILKGGEIEKLVKPMKSQFLSLLTRGEWKCVIFEFVAQGEIYKSVYRERLF